MKKNVYSNYDYLYTCVTEQEQRRRECIRLEKQLEDDQRQQALLAAQAAASKNHLVQFVAKVCA